MVIVSLMTLPESREKNSLLSLFLTIADTRPATDPNTKPVLSL